jgi:hypothetical protein
MATFIGRFVPEEWPRERIAIRPLPPESGTHRCEAHDQEETKSPCRLESAGGPVQMLVAFPAKRDQVGLYVVAKGAAPSHVVNIEVLGASTYLTAPTVTLQDFPIQPRI